MEEALSPCSLPPAPTPQVNSAPHRMHACLLLPPELAALLLFHCGCLRLGNGLHVWLALCPTQLMSVFCFVMSDAYRCSLVMPYQFQARDTPQSLLHMQPLQSAAGLMFPIPVAARKFGVASGHISTNFPCPSISDYAAGCHLVAFSLNSGTMIMTVSASLF